MKGSRSISHPPNVREGQIHTPRRVCTISLQVMMTTVSIICSSQPRPEQLAAPWTNSWYFTHIAANIRAQQGSLNVSHPSNQLHPTDHYCRRLSSARHEGAMHERSVEQVMRDDGEVLLLPCSHSGPLCRVRRETSTSHWSCVDRSPMGV